MEQKSKVVKGSIYKQLIEAFKQMPADLPQDGKNTHFGYSYTSIGVIKRAVARVLKANNIGFAFNVKELKTTTYTTTNKKGDEVITLHTFILVQAVFYNENGETFTVDTYGEGIDSTGKALSKAKSDAWKRVFTDSFIIAGGDIDPNADSGSSVRVSAKNTNKHCSERQEAAIKKMCGALHTTPEFVGVENFDKLTMAQASDIINKLSAEIKKQKEQPHQIHPTHNPTPDNEPSANDADILF